MTRIRSLAALAALGLLSFAPAAPAAEPALRGDVTASRDTLTVGDLVENAPAAVAGTALFRAPALGQSGTIQANRIVAALMALGVGPVGTGGRMQITITRAGRHIGTSEIEAAIRVRLARDHGLDPVATGIVFDAPAPALVVAPDVTGELTASEVTLDRRSRRVSASVWLGPSPTERRTQARVTGIAVELVEVAVATRSLERGQALKDQDVTIERRARDLIPADAVHDGASLEGRVAKRAFPVGSFLRAADLIRPELVARGDIVTVIYDTPGISLSLRAKATDAGALGDTVGLVNPISKKTLQGVVIGQGRVSASTAAPGRLAAVKAAP